MTRAALVAAVMIAVAPAWGDTQRIVSSGDVHRIEVAPAPSGGTGLWATVQNSKGMATGAWVPGTDDAAIDRDPAIEIDPSTALPVLVWSRNEGSGFDLFFSRYAGGAWASPRPLVRGAGDEVEPEIHFGVGVLHVGWRQVDPAGQSTLWRQSFNSGSLALVYGPEKVPLDDPAPVPPSGGSQPATSAPAHGNIYFRGTIPGLNPGDPGRTFVWGVRDEPVPISFRQSFILPSDVTTVSLQGAGFLGGRFTYWFVAGGGDKLYYTGWNGAGWSDMRVVKLGAATTPSDARIMLVDLNKTGS